MFLINRIKFLLPFLSVLMFLNLNVQSQTYGLQFKGIDKSLDNRTGLNLSPDGYLSFQNDFEISFDYRTRILSPNSNRGLFGYIVRVINKENNNVDLLSSIIVGSPDLKLNLVSGNLNSMLEADYPASAIGNWIKLKIKFNLSEDKIILYTPDAFHVQENVGFNKRDEFKIIFGTNDFRQFKTSDVPTMSIRDIKISEGGKLKYHWPLDENRGTETIDRLKKQSAFAVNPSWLSLKHQIWDTQFKQELDGLVMFASNDETNEFYLIGENELTIFSTLTSTIQKVRYKNKFEIKDIDELIAVEYRAFYNSLENKIYCYLNKAEPTYVFDFSTQEWKTVLAKGESNNINYRHHNPYFNASENALYLFGGYGRHKYYNSIRKLNLSDNAFVSLPTNDSIYHPRYLAGLGALNDTIYLLGGYGSKSGNQLINPQSYQGLVGYSIKDSTLFKKFEIPKVIDDMCVGNSMWIDGNTRDYYALIFEKSRFNGELQLLKGSIDKPSVELVGSKLPFEFLDIRSSTGLKYVESQNKLYAYTFYRTDSTTTRTKLYSINYPPNLYVEIVEDVKGSEKSTVYYWIILGLAVVGFFGFLYYKKRNKKSSTVKETPNVEVEVTKTEIADFDNFKVETPDYQLIFFGGFQVVDKNSEDITNNFTPLIKELFLLIWLHTFKNNKGISTEKLTEILWYDKSDKSAQNNRAVNLAKLRTLLRELGDFTLSKETGYWKTVFEQSTIKSDYVDFLNLTSSKTALTEQKIHELIAITKKGAFLRNVQYPWLDEFKAKVSNETIDALIHFAHLCDIETQADFIIHLADNIFIFDSINEEAMVLKCKAHYALGKHSHAKATFKKFSKEYLEMYGEKYEQSLGEILKQ